MPSLSCDKAAFTASVTTLSCTWKLTQRNTESEDTRRNQRKTKKVWISPIDFWSQICRTKDTEDRVEEEKDFRGDLWMDMTRTWRWWQWQEHWESCTGATKVLCGSRRSVFYLWQPNRNNKLQKSIIPLTLNSYYTHCITSCFSQVWTFFKCRAFACDLTSSTFSTAVGAEVTVIQQVWPQRSSDVSAVQLVLTFVYSIYNTLW